MCTSFPLFDIAIAWRNLAHGSGVPSKLIWKHCHERKVEFISVWPVQVCRKCYISWCRCQIGGHSWPPSQHLDQRVWRLGTKQTGQAPNRTTLRRKVKQTSYTDGKIAYCTVTTVLLVLPVSYLTCQEDPGHLWKPIRTASNAPNQICHVCVLPVETSGSVWGAHCDLARHVFTISSGNRARSIRAIPCNP